MPPLVPQQFRPTIIIFIGDTADVTRDLDDVHAQIDPTVYTRFRDLCAGLDSPLRQCVELIAVSEGSSRATRLPLDDWSYDEADELEEHALDEADSASANGRTRQANSARSAKSARSAPGRRVSAGGRESNSTSIPTVYEDEFPVLFGELLRKVQGARQIRDIEAQGAQVPGGQKYSIPETQAQIHIVSHTGSKTISQVNTWILDELKGHRFSTLITYLLLDHPRYPDNPVEMGAATAGVTTTQPIAPTPDSSLAISQQPYIESIPDVAEELPMSGVPQFDGYTDGSGNGFQYTGYNAASAPLTSIANGAQPADAANGFAGYTNGFDGSIGGNEATSGALAPAAPAPMGSNPTSQPNGRNAPPPWLADLIAAPGQAPSVNFAFMYEELDQANRFYREDEIRYTIAQALFALVATGIQAAHVFKQVTEVSPRVGRPNPTDAEITTRQALALAREEQRRAARASALGGANNANGANSAGQAAHVNDPDDPFVRSSANLAAVDPMLSETEQVDSRIGSLGVSMAFFPRAAVERYCANMLGAQFLQSWAESLDEHPLRYRERERTATEAARLAQNIVIGIEDRIARPGAPGNRGPSLEFLSDNAQKEDIFESSRDLFRELSRNAVANHLREGDESDTWAQRAEQQNFKAAARFATWREVAEAAWFKARRESDEAIGKAISALWLGPDEHGLSRAQVYARRLDDAFDRLTRLLPTWRQAHLATYKRKLAALDRRSRGPWLSDPEAQAAATYGVSYALTGSHTALGDAVSSGQQSASVLTDILPADARSVATRLATRAAWARSLTPSLTQLIAAGVMAIPPLFLLVMAIFFGSHQWTLGAALYSLGGVVGGVALLCAVARGYALRRQRNYEEDHLRVYRLYYAYLCSQWEDQLRAGLVRPLARQVKTARERLDDVQRFLKRLREDMQSAAFAAEDDLFDGPSGLRNVFIGNGLELAKRREHEINSYHLSDFFEYVRLRRQGASEQDGKRADERMRDRVRATLADARGGAIRLSDEEIEARLRKVMRAEIRPFLKGNLVNASAALGGSQGTAIWREALSRSTILYRPHTHAPQYLYYAGNEEARQTRPANLGALQSATPIATSNPEWLLLARLQVGGARSRWGTWVNAEDVPLEERLPSRPNWQARSQRATGLPGAQPQGNTIDLQPSGGRS